MESQTDSRRGWLKALVAGLSAINALILTGPLAAYVLSPFERRRDPAATRRLTRLEALPPGRPTLVAVVGERHDAWTTHALEVVGRVWLIRDETAAPDDADAVRAFSAICPHLGCTIQQAAGQEHFICPCHQAEFEHDGRRRGAHSVSPRDMDALECRVVQDNEDGPRWVEVRYEQFEQGRPTRVAKT